MVASAPSLNEPLARISRELDECSLRVERLIEQAGEKLWVAPPRGGWSVGLCIAHLTRTSEEWATRLGPALASAPAGFAPYKPTLGGRMLAWFLEPPYRMKAKAVPIFTPRENKLPAGELIGAFLAAQQEIGRMLRLGNDKAIDRVILPSPVNAKLKYDVYSTFRIIAAHQRRHLWQAERVLAAVSPAPR